MPRFSFGNRLLTTSAVVMSIVMILLPPAASQLALTSVLAPSLGNTTTFAQHTIVGSHRVVDQVLL
jgi:hypothetical protein